MEMTWHLWDEDYMYINASISISKIQFAFISVTLDVDLLSVNALWNRHETLLTQKSLPRYIVYDDVSYNQKFYYDRIYTLRLSRILAIFKPRRPSFYKRNNFCAWIL